MHASPAPRLCRVAAFLGRLACFAAVPAACGGPRGPEPPVARESPLPAAAAPSQGRDEEVRPPEPADAPVAGDPGAATGPEAAESTDGLREVEVTTAAELVAAIAPHTRVVVATDEIRLHELWPTVEIPLWDDTQDGPPPPENTEWVRWTNPYDGWQLEIYDVEELQLVGRGSPAPRILTNPRGSFVLKFVDSAGITLEHLTLGHTTDGFCRGGVLAFEKTKQIRIRDAELFGSGTYGVELAEVEDASFEEVTIRGCTYGIAVLRAASGVVFNGCTFRDNREFDLVQASERSDALFEDCLFENNRAERDSSMFLGEGRSRLLVRASVLRGNTGTRLVSGSGVEFEQVTLDGNIFDEPLPRDLLAPR
jgi:hypothetical protein